MINRHFLQAFFSRWAPLYRASKADRAETAKRFNIFEALLIENDELTHSAFLAYLLDPSASHDQGDKFLSSFLSCLNIPGSLDDTQLKLAGVNKEFFIGEKGRLDIVIFIPTGPVIAIENKVWAQEGSDQVRRYQEWMEKEIKGEPERGSCVVFLTPEGREPTTRKECSSISVIHPSYRGLAGWLRRLRSVNNLPERIGVILDMYISLCESIERRTQ